MEKVKVLAAIPVCCIVVMFIVGASGTTVPTTVAPCKPGTYGSGGNNCRNCGNCTSQPCDTQTGACTGGCFPGYTGSKCDTLCENGKYGQDCAQRCSQNCASFPCDKVTGTCSCKPGFKEPTCTSACNSGTYGNCKTSCGRCKNGAYCDKVTGACTACEPGYQYSDSNRLCKTKCIDGQYGDACNKGCSGNCEDVCNKATGHCRCKPGFTPASKCTAACDYFHWGRDCTTSCGSFCVTPSQGQRKCNNIDGRCSCQKGYRTPHCTTQCSAGKYGQDCAENCNKCVPGDVCNHVNGNCTRCQDNWELPLCKVCLPGHWGIGCGQLCGHCGGDGRCNPVSGHCDSGCLPGWTSPSCDQKCPERWYGQNCTQACGTCRGNSVCRHDNGVCELDCEDGYEGVLCKTEKESLVGPIVGSVMAAAIIIALAIGIVAFCYFRRYSHRQELPPQTPEKDACVTDFPTLAELHMVQPGDADPSSQRQSQIYQNVNPAFNSNYDHVERRPRGDQQDEHHYDSQTALSTAALVNTASSSSSPHPSAATKGSAQEDPVYQNSSEVVKPGFKALKPVKEKKAGVSRDGAGDAHGNDRGNLAAPDATYGNL